ncbi:hypothetical protein HPG69_012543 [Diceros bicornis minor]|uniref:VWF/SSPO/Zonadhesin-like cysteine-rich domain-containing protein n=1 Tax=Diceros bicornis minor TaxID=77932 RepID=A0A7J7F8E5_DICBM|nr:hypothetical protein HPG69_012543 [Diceros bicornis minor]
MSCWHQAPISKIAWWTYAWAPDTAPCSASTVKPASCWVVKSSPSTSRAHAVSAQGFSPAIVAHLGNLAPVLTMVQLLGCCLSQALIMVRPFHTYLFRLRSVYGPAPKLLPIPIPYGSAVPLIHGPLCPAHSHYKLCALGCPATCAGLKPTLGCKGSGCCLKGCVCHAGFVLRGATCMPMAQTGCPSASRCLESGALLPPLHPATGCCCHCHCGGREACKPCHAAWGGPGLCLASGGLHYRTFDSTTSHLPDACTYSLLGTGTGHLRGVRPFEVVLEKGPGMPMPLHVCFHHFGLDREGWGHVKVSPPCHPPPFSCLPVSVLAGRISVHRPPLLSSLQHPHFHSCLPPPFSPLHLLPSLLLPLHLSIPFPIAEWTAWCAALPALCVDQARGASVVLGVPGGRRLLFGRGCHLSVALPVASHVQPLRQLQRQRSGCSAAAEAQALRGAAFLPGFRLSSGHRGHGCRHSMAQRLRPPIGPLAPCHSCPPPEPFFQACVADMGCAQGNHKVLCTCLQAYVAACPTAGDNVPAGGRPAFVPSQIILIKNYSSSCTCELGEGVTHVPFSYPTEEVCDITDGVLGCRLQGDQGCGLMAQSPPSPTVLAEPLVCTATGDFRFHTSGGAHCDFPGSCVYRLVGLCGTAYAHLESFSLGLAPLLQPPGCTKALTLLACSLRPDMSLKDLNRIRVRLLKPHTDPPSLTVPTTFRISADCHDPLPCCCPHPHALSVGGRNSRITAVGSWPPPPRLSPGPLALRRYGLQPLDDTIGTARHGPYLCGVCRPGGPPAPFPDTWKVAKVPGRGPACGPLCLGPRPVATRTRFAVKAYCGLLAAAEGPLRPCYALLDPLPLLDDCLDAVCPALAAYTVACQALGVRLRPWRTPDFCPVRPVLPATCEGRESCSDRSSGCREGCVCDAGFVLRGAAYVRAAKADRFRAAATARWPPSGTLDRLRAPLPLPLPLPLRLGRRGDVRAAAVRARARVRPPRGRAPLPARRPRAAAHSPGPRTYSPSTAARSRCPCSRPGL